MLGERGRWKQLPEDCCRIAVVSCCCEELVVEERRMSPLEAVTRGLARRLKYVLQFIDCELVKRL
jgi:hypothetical protein